MEYNFAEIEKNWKKYWNDQQVYKVNNASDKPKCYILDMFPYPSGAGLHVGHPLGYIASDIYARYKRLKGYNVLHPMGFDAFGLPAEQYAMETGQHPAVTTEKNIARYREQLDNIGFCYDWDRSVRTSDASYYKWTQWIFLQLFHSWYDRNENKARPLTELIVMFEQEGNTTHTSPGNPISFSAGQWNSYSEKEKREILMQYRLAYQGYAQVWWCEALGTVLANDEVVNGVSERGGHPVERKNMRQWFLRITEYAERLISSLDTLDWSDAMKEMQRNWIGKSVGAEVRFDLSPTLSEGEGDELRLSADSALVENGAGKPEASLGHERKDSEKETTDSNTKPGWNTAEASLYNLIGPMRTELKENMTEPERILWRHLKANQLGVKFRRQHIIGRFVADFVCLPAKLIVEVDGKIHEQRQEQDADRTEYLAEKGFKVIRFTNDEVIANIDEVITQIKKCIQAQVAPGNQNENTDATPTTTQNTDNDPISTGNTGTEPTAIQNTGTKPTSLSEGEGGAGLSVFTTRPDTIFGVDFMVLAPEHELVDEITTEAQRTAIDAYKTYVKSRSERERMSEVKQVTGCFTGAYAEHPLSGRQIPIWISEYVLAGYGTGAIMAVPSGDDRDHAFAKHFNIPITNIFGDLYTGEKAYSDKGGIIQNSDFLSGMSVADATAAAIEELEDIGAGTKKINYRLRDAGFSRQRYWGEPFPIIYVDGVPYGTDENLSPTLSEGEGGGLDTRVSGAASDVPDFASLPVELPMVEHYKPAPEGQGPLANIEDWVHTEAGERETNTMPGYAGSSWYFLRYMDPHNDAQFASREATDYWNQVDLYIGGTEHAVGHLLYSRMWTKALCDLGYIGFDEPFKKLLNQGMIQGSSRFVYRVNGTNKFVSYGLRKEYEVTDLRVDVTIVDGLELDTEAFKKWRPVYADAEFILEDGKYICGAEVEKMSKGKYNVVNPDDIVAQYGADTFRMYEMFLGPIDISKPWDTKGIEGVHRFLKKLWRLYNDEQKGWIVTDDAATDAELRLLHKTIKKIGDDIERFSFNTSVSQFMICVNELSALNCHKRAILERLAVSICAFAPHIAEQLWHQFGHTTSVIDATFPQYEERYTIDNSKQYGVAINGKTRVEMEFALDADPANIEQQVLADAIVQKWMEGKPMKKFIYVKGKMINVVV